MELSSNEFSTNVVETIYVFYNCIFEASSHKINQNCGNSRNLLDTVILLWKIPQIICFYGNLLGREFKFQNPKICLWKDFNFSHVCHNLRNSDPAIKNYQNWCSCCNSKNKLGCASVKLLVWLEFTKAISYFIKICSRCSQEATFKVSSKSVQ